VRKLRAALILMVFFVFTVPLMPVQLVLRFVNPHWARAFPHWYHRLLCRLLGVTIHLSGQLAEDRPVLLIANHISWVDIPVMSSVVPASFVAKSEVSTWPFISWLAKLQATVFVDRTQPRRAGSSANEIMARLRDGDHIVIFAEGTTSDGNQVLPFKTSLFAVAKPGRAEANAMHNGIYVQTMAIAYTRQQGLPLCRRGRPIIAWYGDMKIASHAWQLLKRGPLDVHVHIGAPVKLDDFKDRKHLAAFTHGEVRDAVADILAPRKEAASEGLSDKG